jgi:hypothetical protein
MPALTAGLDAKQAESLLTSYKQLHDVNLESTLRLFDVVVGRTLFPLLTSFVGFVFGSARSRNA